VFLLSFDQNVAQKLNNLGFFLKCGPEANLGWPSLLQYIWKFLQMFRKVFNSFGQQLQPTQIDPLKTPLL
jgi:hypothetical protein